MLNFRHLLAEHHIYGPAIGSQERTRARLFRRNNGSLPSLPPPQQTKVFKVTLRHIRDVLPDEESHLKAFNLALAFCRLNIRDLKVLKTLEDGFVRGIMLGNFALCLAVCDEFFRFQESTALVDAETGLELESPAQQRGRY